MDILITFAAILIVCVLNSTLNKFAAILTVYVSAALIYVAVHREMYAVCVYKDYGTSTASICHEFTI